MTLYYIYLLCFTTDPPVFVAPIEREVNMLPIVDCAVDSNPVGDMKWRQKYNNGTVRNVTDIVQGTLYNLITYYFYWCSFAECNGHCAGLIVFRL